MDIVFYLEPFLIAFFLTIVGISFLQMILRRVGVKNIRKNERHIHTKNISRFGGIALVVAFLATLFMNTHLILTSSWWGIVFVSVLILGIGFWDDIREISWRWQLMVQILAGMIAFSFGIRMTSLVYPLGTTIFFFDSGWMLGVNFVMTIAWIVVIMNAMNWADGMDGLCGGVSLIGFSTIFFLSLRPEVNQPPMAILALALVGASLGFLVFNFYPAHIFAGTSGSWFLGFMMAALALFSGAKVATVILVLILPLSDALWVIVSRFRAGVSIFVPDKQHLHHRLHKIGWSSQMITLFVYSVTMIIAVIALHTNAIGKMITFVFATISATLFFVWVQKQSILIEKKVT